MTIEEIKTIFKEKGLKATEPRIAVYRYLIDHPTHPDVENVYADLLAQCPSLSRTTVYNCLQVLAEHHLILPITIDNERIRYDATTDFHGHFRCTICGVIYDFPVREMRIPALAGFDIRQKDVYCNGVCDRCRRSE